MKKRVKQRTFSRKAGPRKALAKSLLRALVLKEKIQTTQAKAKEIAPMAEKLITKAKSASIAQRRHMVALLGEDAAKKLMNEVAKKYQERKGGYTRIIKMRPRRSDNAALAILELV